MNTQAFGEDIQGISRTGRKPVKIVPVLLRLGFNSRGDLLKLDNSRGFLFSRHPSSADHGGEWCNKYQDVPLDCCDDNVSSSQLIPDLGFLISYQCDFDVRIFPSFLVIFTVGNRSSSTLARYELVFTHQHPRSSCFRRI